MAGKIGTAAVGAVPRCEPDGSRAESPLGYDGISPGFGSHRTCFTGAGAGAGAAGTEGAGTEGEATGCEGSTLGSVDGPTHACVRRRASALAWSIG